MISPPSWILALHIVGIILWMGGLFMLTRHVGMHVEQPDAPIDALRDYESKSYYMVVLPGFLLALGTGLYMLLTEASAMLSADGPWGATFHAKLALLVVVIIADQFFHLRMRHFHNKGFGKRGIFMAVHGVVGLVFIAIAFLMMGQYLA
ncbi:MAG: CopD family protein [Persicimonas sp.]